MALRKLPAFAQSASVAVPTVVGWRAPVVLLPTQFSTGDASYDPVIVHELAHVQRRDVPVQSAARLTRALCWWHPLAWLIARELRTTAEEACDDWAIAVTRRRREYANTLVQWAEAAASVGSVACAYRGKALVGRVKRILTESSLPTLRLPARVKVLLAACAICAIAAAGAFRVQARQPQATLDEEATELTEFISAAMTEHFTKWTQAQIAQYVEELRQTILSAARKPLSSEQMALLKASLARMLAEEADNSVRDYQVAEYAIYTAWYVRCFLEHQPLTRRQRAVLDSQIARLIAEARAQLEEYAAPAIGQGGVDELTARIERGVDERRRDVLFPGLKQPISEEALAAAEQELRRFLPGPADSLRRTRFLDSGLDLVCRIGVRTIAGAGWPRMPDDLVRRLREARPGITPEDMAKLAGPEAAAIIQAAPLLQCADATLRQHLTKWTELQIQQAGGAISDTVIRSGLKRPLTPQQIADFKASFPWMLAGGWANEEVDARAVRRSCVSLKWWIRDFLEREPLTPEQKALLDRQITGVLGLVRSELQGRVGSILGEQTIEELMRSLEAQVTHRREEALFPGLKAPLTDEALSRLEKEMPVWVAADTFNPPSADKLSQAEYQRALESYREEVAHGVERWAGMITGAGMRMPEDLRRELSRTSEEEAAR
jgi:hypothetical protein